MAPSQHFSYLLDGPRPAAQVSSERLDTLAKTAARRYIDGRVPLNDSVVKLAAENDLNPQQIERVCEMANIATHQALWPKTAAKHELAFPVANADVVIKLAGHQTPSRSSSGMKSDYAGPPSGLPR